MITMVRILRFHSLAHKQVRVARVYNNTTHITQHTIRVDRKSDPPRKIAIKEDNRLQMQCQVRSWQRGKKTLSELPTKRKLMI